MIQVVVRYSYCYYIATCTITDITAEDSSADDSPADDSPYVPLKDIQVPSEFIFPDFREEEKKAHDMTDIFNFDCRTIKQFWIDSAKSILQGVKTFPSDRYQVASCN